MSAKKDNIRTLLALVTHVDNRKEMDIEEWNHYVDRIEAAMVRNEIADFDTKHRFADGMYIREIFMPKGSMVVSNIHKTNSSIHNSSGGG
jgi:hypothetical protein